jgi:hypothetical protein
MTADQAFILAQALTQVAWALMAVAAAGLAVAGSFIVWTVVEYKAWKTEQRNG